MSQPPLIPQSFDEAIAQINGEDLGKYRERRAKQDDLWDEARHYLNLPPQKWPPLIFNWDLSAEGQRFAFDGLTPDQFAMEYPAGLVLGWTVLAEFDKVLCHFSRRDGPDELWELGSASSLATMIAYLRRGLPITPPAVYPTDTSQVILRGGHHRYASAKATSLSELPILVEPTSKDEISERLRIRWNDA